MEEEISFRAGTWVRAKVWICADIKVLDQKEKRCGGVEMLLSNALAGMHVGGKAPCEIRLIGS